MTRTDDIDAAARILRDAKVAVALTGAGISVDSGIPDFRSPGGLWERFDPMEYATIEAFVSSPRKVWSMLFEMMDVVESARANPGHTALAELEAMGRLDAIVTQNIDNLHQAGGSRRVIDFHGNSRRLVCLRCGRADGAERFAQLRELSTPPPPECVECGAILKPDVVLFGEAIPDRAARDAAILAASCDLMLVIGTSAMVYPAAGLPVTAKSRGAKIIEINLEPTHLTGTLADLTIMGGATQVLPALVERVRALG